MSHVAQLRLEHAQLQNRANYIEEEAAQNLQAGRHAVALVTRKRVTTVCARPSIPTTIPRYRRYLG